MSSFGWGVLGPGRIARQFCRDLAKIEDAHLESVGSRSLERAQAFAEEYGGRNAYGSYLELAQDPAVQAIYVSTPHPFHLPCARLCLEHGKAVLCEKPLTANLAQAQELVSVAREHGAFLMEANWTRFLPTVQQAKRWIHEGRIGEVRMVHADFGFRAGWDPENRLLNPALAGGALLDVGVYVVSFANMFLGEPETVHASGHVGETGVDEQVAMVLGYKAGAVASLTCAVRTATPHNARICGTEGWIELPDFWHGTQITLQRRGEAPEVLEGAQGYHFEALEVMRCVRKGLSESPTITMDNSLAIAAALQSARDQLGVVYPFEEA